MNERQTKEIKYGVTDTVFGKREFENICQSAYSQISKRDMTSVELEVLCQYMLYIQAIGRKENVIKFWPGKSSTVLESDISVCQIKDTITKLDAQISGLELSTYK